MTKRTRAALERAHQLAQDLTLDTEIHSAASPFRVTPADLTHFDAQFPAATSLLAARQAQRLERVIGGLGAERAQRARTPETERGGLGERSVPQNSRTTPSFGDLIRTARESSNLPLQTLALHLHIHHTYLSGLESNTRSPLALGPDTARRLVTLLNLPPHLAAQSLQLSMQAALLPTPSFSNRMRRNTPRKDRLKILESALPKSPDPDQERAWRTLIDAVLSLESQTP